MSSFILCGEKDSGHTLVPDFFLDHYMPEANGEYVKIYLYLLRCLKSEAQELSIPLIADKFDRTEGDVCRALKYWERMHLLKLEYDASSHLTGIRMLREQSPAPETDIAKAPVSQKEPASSDRLPADLFSPEEARQLLFICEQYLGRTLSSTEVAKILDLHDSLGFSADLIEYLVEYCVSGGHKSIHYIEATARGWHQAGCRTAAQAKEQTTTYNRSYFQILKAFGIAGRNPVDAEISYMNKWMKEYGFSTELILKACGRTMAAIHQPSFEYTDSILSSWKKNGVSSLSDLEALDRSRKDAMEKERTASDSRGQKDASGRRSSSSRFHNFQERDYDFGELEKQLINR